MINVMIIFFSFIAIWGVYMHIVSRIMGKEYVSKSLKNMDIL